MKITYEEPTFNPVTLVIETHDELQALLFAIREAKRNTLSSFRDTFYESILSECGE
jgi:hypothetical protein